MSPKQGKVILRVALDEELIRQLKHLAIEADCRPSALVEAALRSYLKEKGGER